VPRVGLNTDKVVAAASELIDEVGLDNLTLAALAERLQVKLPSLYKHIDGLDDLRDRVCEAAQAESFTIVKEATIGKTGDEAIASIAHALRRWALAHPGRYAITIVKPLRPDSAAQLLDFLLLILAGINLTGDTAIDAARALRASLHGFVSLESSGGFGLPADVDRSFARYTEGLIRELHSWAD
jgi:AcrR family transcriptional regulator